MLEEIRSFRRQLLWVIAAHVLVFVLMFWLLVVTALGGWFATQVK